MPQNEKRIGRDRMKGRMERKGGFFCWEQGIRLWKGNRSTRGRGRKGADEVTIARTGTRVHVLLFFFQSFAHRASFFPLSLSSLHINISVGISIGISNSNSNRLPPLDKPEIEPLQSSHSMSHPCYFSGLSPKQCNICLGSLLSSRGTYLSSFFMDSRFILHVFNTLDKFTCKQKTRH